MGRVVKIWGLLALLVLGAYAVYVGLTTPGLKPVVISAYEPAIIQPTETVHHLGTVPIDDKVSHTFLIYNVGGKPLVISDVEASCGCTVARISENIIGPGSFAEVDVTLDTSIKLGKVRKKITVYSNDPAQPELDLFLEGQVAFDANDPETMAMHAGLKVKDPLVLFKGECATCHVARGEGKSGKALFQADCGMCHGINAQGAVALNLLDGNYEDPAHLEHIRTVILSGSPNTPTMPPFGDAHGGPLNEAQVDSLVNFLKYQASLHRDGKLDADGEPLDTDPKAEI
jgi:mono/diheme cytochrome c family protein